MTLSVKKAISRIPHWSGLADLNITPLSGGITNENFRIDVKGQVYVIRIPGANTELLGIDRYTECLISREAGDLGIGPKVFYFIEPEGCLVTHFIEGVHPSQESLGHKDNIRRVAKVIKRIHKMSPTLKYFSPYQVIINSIEIAQNFKIKFPADFYRLIEKLHVANYALSKTPFIPRLCHNDLLNENFLDDGEIRIIDWEYAGMGDPVFDLANFSAHHEFTNEQDRTLLKYYFGEIPASYWEKFKILKIVSYFREAMWAMVQCGISKIDFDFHAYADKFFSRTENGISDDNWTKWINKLTTNFSD